MVPKVAAIHDLSGLGRCSLTAAIPILSVMGVQACPLPTAVLSNQTGYASYAAVDLTGQMEDAIREWKKQQLHFDGIFTGFLMDTHQVDLVADCIDAFRTPDGTVVVDPVLGDDGALYPVYGQSMVEAVRSLIQAADVITPNLTEACLLAGTEHPAGPVEDAFIWTLGEQLCKIGPQQVVISGVGQVETICNFAFTAGGERHKVCNRRSGGGYSGTGDILASVICGTLVQGNSIRSGLEKAAKLLEAAVAEAYEQGIDPNDGIPFERHLHVLI